MSYSSDVFLSYRRANAWPKFVGSIFMPMFDHWLGAELGRKPEVFFDIEDIETGASWPRKLADGLASSKLMVCLWSTEYFSSDWCKAELCHMLTRREESAIMGDPLPLVIAVVIHDGDKFPNALSDIQRFHIQRYANPWMASGSRKQEELSEQIRKLASHVAHALELAPNHDPRWRNIAIDKFADLFHQRLVHQNRLPSLGGPGL